MSEISGITKLTSKPKASLETISAKKEVQASQEFKQLEGEMREIDQAFTLVQEIRHSLETLLKDL